jgi:hypothetical protein
MVNTLIKFPHFIVKPNWLSISLKQLPCFLFLLTLTHSTRVSYPLNIERLSCLINSQIILGWLLQVILLFDGQIQIKSLLLFHSIVFGISIIIFVRKTFQPWFDNRLSFLLPLNLTNALSDGPGFVDLHESLLVWIVSLCRCYTREISVTLHRLL